MNYSAGAVTQEEAEALSASFRRQHGFPGDARLVSCSALFRQVSGEEAEIVAFVLHYGHGPGGVPVAGDRISLIVQKDGVKTVLADWHRLSEGASRGRRPEAFTGAALQACVDDFRKRHSPRDRPLEVDCVRPVYYVGDIRGARPQRARLVWQVCFKDAGSVLWDPRSRRPIRRAPARVTRRRGGRGPGAPQRRE